METNQLENSLASPIAQNPVPGPIFFPIQRDAFLNDGHAVLIDLEVAETSEIRFAMQQESHGNSAAALTFYRDAPALIRQAVIDRFENVVLLPRDDDPSGNSSTAIWSARRFLQHALSARTAVEMRVLNVVAGRGQLRTCIRTAWGYHECRDVPTPDGGNGSSSMPIATFVFDSVPAHPSPYAYLEHQPPVGDSDDEEPVRVTFDLRYNVSVYEQRADNVLGHCRVFTPALMPPTPPDNSTATTTAITKFFESREHSDGSLTCRWTSSWLHTGDPWRQARYVTAQREGPAYPEINSLLLMNGRCRYPEQLLYDLAAFVWLAVNLVLALGGTILLTGFVLLVFCLQCLDRIFSWRRRPQYRGTSKV